MKLSRLGGVALCVVSLSACATITRGTKENYVIETDPPGAHIALSTGQHCVTPCRLKLPRRAGFTVTATHDGYQTATANVTSSVHGGGATAVAGNLVFGGLIGGVIDSTNGSMNDLRPNPLHIVMTRADAAPAADPAAAPAPAPQPAATPTAASGSPQGN